MKYLVYALAFCLYPTGAALAGDEQPATGQAPAPAAIDDRFYESKPRSGAADEQSEHCRRLRDRITELKGKPQRRHAAVQRYDQECRSGYIPRGQQPGFNSPLR